MCLSCVHPERLLVRVLGPILPGGFGTVWPVSIEVVAEGLTFEEKLAGRSCLSHYPASMSTAYPLPLIRYRQKLLHSSLSGLQIHSALKGLFNYICCRCLRTFMRSIAFALAALQPGVAAVLRRRQAGCSCCCRAPFSCVSTTGLALGWWTAVCVHFRALILRAALNTSNDAELW